MTASQGSTTMRNIPDVALTGDNVYVLYNNGGREHSAARVAPRRLGGLYRVD